MSNKLANPVHPGLFVKENVLPKGMTVTEAARLLAVGRPAFSNFLNGKAALSAEMATRLEKTFSVDKEHLFKLQREFDSATNRDIENKVIVSSYVPSFLTITAHQIDHWASGLDARKLLSVLLRKLIHSTTPEISNIDFPGFDNAERKGWDGFLECGQATPWVPQGKSGWEFGCNANPAQKAEHDYLARTKSVDAAQRARSTFIFVTPRNWPGKTKWEQDKSALGEWNAVKVLDASDLEQWLEQSIPAQIWLAEQLGLPVTGFSTLDHWWEKWADASEPAMTRELFEPTIGALRSHFIGWLNKPSTKPLTVAADSREEGLAFLAAMFADVEIAKIPHSSTVSVFNDPSTLRKLGASSATFIPVVYTNDMERELIKMCKQRHCISIQARGTIRSKPDVVLEKIGADYFQAGLAAMGIDQERSARLARESGRSLTVLRRRLSLIESVRHPTWASDPVRAAALVPMSLIGSWKETSKADREIVSLLAKKEYAAVEADLVQFLQSEDAPVWSIESGRGVISKVDVLFAISGLVTREHLDDFLGIAKLVLSEADPALELPERDRWAAGMYGKVRDHSATLREALCETMVLLAMHGNDLFSERLGLNVQSRVEVLVRDLLTPFTLDKLQLQDRNLPYYAEAAPDMFLTLVDTDLRSLNSAVMGLMKPVEPGIFSTCWRTGILWALECIVWKAGYLPRVTLALGKMAEQKLDDNWNHKPINTLKAIYRWWLPQTAASADERISGLKLLAKKFPETAWDICLEQIRPERFALPNYKPRWRDDADGLGEPRRLEEGGRFRLEALRLAITWTTHNEKTLGDLIERINIMPEEEQSRIWDLVDDWTKNASEVAKSVLRERIRRSAFTRRGRRKDLKGGGRNRAQIAYEKLASKDPVFKYKWIFESDWVEPSYDELEDEHYDYKTSTKKIAEDRKKALQEIWREQGLDGVIKLANEVEPVHLVAGYLFDSNPKGLNLSSLLTDVIDDKRFNSEQKRDGFVSTLLRCVSLEMRDQFFDRAIESGIKGVRLAKLLTLAPCDRATWNKVGHQSKTVRAKYWQTVRPWVREYTEDDLALLIDALLEEARPRAAFFAAHMDWSKIETPRLMRLLKALISSNESVKEYQLEAYDISAAFESLNSRPDKNVEQLANLEFQFIGVLTDDDTEYGIPNLQREFSKSPKLFADIVAMATKRSDDAQDPPELIIQDLDKQQQVAKACYTALNHINQAPGYDKETQSIDVRSMLDWLTEARSRLSALGRQNIGDQFIGQLLARHNPESEADWPADEICEALETMGSDHIAKGFANQIFNSRGVHWTSGDGQQERELAQKYRSHSRHLAFEYPFVSSILESIAATYDRLALSEEAEGKRRKQSLME